MRRVLHMSPERIRARGRVRTRVAWILNVRWEVAPCMCDCYGTVCAGLRYISRVRVEWQTLCAGVAVGLAALVTRGVVECG